MLAYWFHQFNISEVDLFSEHSIYAHNLPSISDSEDQAQPSVSVISSEIDSESLYGKVLGMSSHFTEQIGLFGDFKNPSSNFRIQAYMELLDSGIILPLVISSETHTYEIHKSLVQVCQQSNTVFIHHHINGIDDSLELDDNQWKKHRISFIGIQKHLCFSEIYDKWAENSYNFIRLGQLRNHFQDAEVVLREADYIEFNINSIRKNELPGNSEASLCGFSLEEACQLMRYIGHSKTLKILNITGINQDTLNPDNHYEAIALLIWYFLEARGELNLHSEWQTNNRKKYVVHMDYMDIPLHFYQSSLTDQWWVSIEKEQECDAKLIACSKRDFQLATQNEISPRLLKILDLSE